MRVHRFIPVLLLSALTLTAPAAKQAHAAPDAASIAINFAAEEPEGQFLGEVEGPAGVLDTVNWNNFEGNIGEEDLSADVGGTVTASTASVNWTSNNTWASDGRGNEDLNEAEEDTPNRALMTGYLDTNATDPSVVIVEGLDPVFTDAGYDVYVYMLGGVLDRGGDYTIGDVTLEHDDLEIFEGEFIEGAEGNYLVFEGVMGDSFELLSQPLRGGNPRAPVNAIEIVAAGGGGGGDGDFNGDGILDAADIDALSAEVLAGTNNASFDLTGDAVVDDADRSEWVNNLRKTWFGDSDLNGEFASGDLVTVFSGGKFESGNPAGWADGDWNGDGVFNSTDFVTAFSGGGYENGPRAATAAVPEPGSMSLLLLGALGFLSRRR